MISRPERRLQCHPASHAVLKENLWAAVTFFMLISLIVHKGLYFTQSARTKAYCSGYSGRLTRTCPPSSRHLLHTHLAASATRPKNHE